MFLHKKTFICTLFLFLSINGLKAKDENRVDFKNRYLGQDFVIGFGIGFAHGVTNRLITKNNSWDDLSNKPQHIVTFGAASFAEGCWNDDGNVNLFSLWGRGIGQCLAESIDGKGFSFNCNLSLMAAAVLGMLAVHRKTLETITKDAGEQTVSAQNITVENHKQYEQNKKII